MSLIACLIKFKDMLSDETYMQELALYVISYIYVFSYARIDILCILGCLKVMELLWPYYSASLTPYARAYT